jgi:3-methyladenine DNA glycosylase AlkC
MAEPFKNLFNQAFVDEMCEYLLAFKVLRNKNDVNKFHTLIFDNDWKDRELKSRMRHIATVLKYFLPADFPEACEIIINIVNEVKAGKEGMSLQYMVLADYVEQFGLEHLKDSIKAMEVITQYASCEFAVRSFIIRNPDKMMKQMLLWSKHSSFMVRRFASEGCRPLLPWAIVLHDLKSDPSPILPILEILKDDESEFVRKSVANNLNDISKNQPQIVIDITKKWKDKSKNTDWILKHGCRTLLKQGNSKVLELFGFGNTDGLAAKNFSIENKKVKMGKELSFRFDLQNSYKEDLLVRLEYAVYLLRANGKHNKKVFKISEKRYPADSTSKVMRKHSFRKVTTRRYYPGLHKISIILNGKEFQMHEFELV